MRRRFCRIAFTTLMGAGALSGCMQMTRHSNTMIFGTNTSLGIKVGAEATATPGITVGYNRQEVVVMPLVANTADNGTVQGPCPQVVVDSTVAVLALPTSCLLQGKADVDTDTYSVLASFGARFGSELEPGNRALDGQIAQYFATGIAARLLAENGGAATIALGGAAKSAAVRLHGISKADLPSTGAVELEARAIGEARASVAGAVATKGTDFRTFLSKIDDGAKTGTQFTRACPKAADASACSAVIAGTESLQGLMLSQWALAKAVQ